MMCRIGQVRETVEIVSQDLAILKERLRQRKFQSANYHIASAAASTCVRKISLFFWPSRVGLETAWSPSPRVLTSVVRMVNDSEKAAPLLYCLRKWLLRWLS